MKTLSKAINLDNEIYLIYNLMVKSKVYNPILEDCFFICRKELENEN